MPVSLSYHAAQPLFGAKKGQGSPKRLREAENDEISDCIEVAHPKQKLRLEPEADEVLLQRQFESEMEQAEKKIQRLSFIDPEPHLRVAIPALGSYDPKKHHPTGLLVTPEEFARTYMRHAPQITHAILEELHEQGVGARKAIRDLAVKADNPARKIGKQSGAYLKAAGLMEHDGSVKPEILNDVRHIVDVEDFSDRITLTFPKRLLLQG